MGGQKYSTLALFIGFYIFGLPIGLSLLLATSFSFFINDYEWFWIMKINVYLVEIEWKWRWMSEWVNAQEGLIMLYVNGQSRELNLKLKEY